MRIVGNCEYALVLYRNKLPKFNNNGKMIFNCMDWEKDTTSPKLHPTQKPVAVLKKLISIFTDEGEVVIDPVAGSGSTLIAAHQLGRKAYGFEIKKEYYITAQKWIDETLAQKDLFITENNQRRIFEENKTANAEIGYEQSQLHKIRCHDGTPPGGHLYRDADRGILCQRGRKRYLPGA